MRGGQVRKKKESLEASNFLLPQGYLGGECGSHSGPTFSCTDMTRDTDDTVYFITLIQ